MNDKTDMETLDTFIRNRWDEIMFAIVAIKNDNVSIFSIAFFDRFLTEFDFNEMRIKIEQDKPGIFFNLRMAYLEEMEEARKQYLQNEDGFDVSTYNINSTKH